MLQNHPFIQHVVSKVRRFYPTNHVNGFGQRVQDWWYFEPYRCRFGNEVVLQKVPGLRAEYCQYCSVLLEPGEMAMAIFKYRHSQGWQCGRYHVSCWDKAVKAAPRVKDFCWLTGLSGWLNGDSGYVRKMKVERGKFFTATEKELLRIKRRYQQCQSREGVQRILEEYRQRMVQPTIWHYYTKACRAMDSPFGNLRRKEKELKMWERVVGVR